MNKTRELKLIHSQVSRRLELLRPFGMHSQEVTSWIDYIRVALGMSVSQLAKKVGISQSTMTDRIRLEKEGRITVHKLREIAAAMECDLVYAFVPRKKIEDLVLDQAIKKTKAFMEEAETHMSLEDQKVTLDKNERMKDLVEERMYSKYLWDE